MREIGIDVKRPTGEWDGDENCPFYGSLRLRGQMFEALYPVLVCRRQSPSSVTTFDT